ncbi:surface-adhesin E family protein [Neisseria montereyensis]|uniref:Surface-adhesin protein E-like domain-containing protein n=1 Tax=Neisseria montereyensis TaxID=2973938 RepID=A0ABT2FDS9_9NEIS|nr:surface-adhesin E family protein [Neisseria montereyensis]MCS4534293.1 hypothetical protein [Neisseria montereyensis]
MNFYRFCQRTAAVSLALWVAACSTTGMENVVGSSWSSIGTTSDGNIKAYIDKNSISKNGNLVTFRDRKVVVDQDKERYVNTPRYKTAIGTWEMHCANKTYRLTALQLLDERGTVVVNENYTAVDLRPMSVMNGSVTEKQFEQVCGQSL